jgi:hypothetical protein
MTGLLPAGSPAGLLCLVGFLCQFTCQTLPASSPAGRYYLRLPAGLLFADTYPGCYDQPRAAITYQSSAYPGCCTYPGDFLYQVHLPGLPTQLGFSTRILPGLLLPVVTFSASSPTPGLATRLLWIHPTQCYYLPGLFLYPDSPTRAAITFPGISLPVPAQ